MAVIVESTSYVTTKAVARHCAYMAHYTLFFGTAGDTTKRRLIQRANDGIILNGSWIDTPENTVKLLKSKITPEHGGVKLFITGDDLYDLRKSKLSHGYLIEKMIGILKQLKEEVNITCIYTMGNLGVDTAVLAACELLKLECRGTYPAGYASLNAAGQKITQSRWDILSRVESNAYRYKHLAK